MESVSSPLASPLSTPSYYSMSAHQSDQGWLPVDVSSKAYLYTYPSPGPVDQDGHRGRTKHRSLARCDMAAINSGRSRESSTLRGRPRRRSTSPFAMTPSRGSSPKARLDESVSPSRKRLLRIVFLDRRRSQSPSRSRSPNCNQKNATRRRQRTRSRSRSHAKEQSYRSQDQEGDLRYEALLRQATKSPTKED